MLYLPATIGGLAHLARASRLSREGGVQKNIVGLADLARASRLSRDGNSAEKILGD
jgi:hypothetical protein